MDWMGANILYRECCCFYLFFFSLQFTKCLQTLLISMLLGQYRHCPLYLVATSTESLMQQGTLSATVALPVKQWLLRRRKKQKTKKTQSCCKRQKTEESKRGASCHTECRMGAKSEQWSSAALDLHSKHYNCTGFPCETMTQHGSDRQPTGWSQVRDLGGVGRGQSRKPRAVPILNVEQMAMASRLEPRRFRGRICGCLWCTESAEWS